MHPSRWRRDGHALRALGARQSQQRNKSIRPLQSLANKGSVARAGQRALCQRSTESPLRAPPEACAAMAFAVTRAASPMAVAQIAPLDGRPECMATKRPQILGGKRLGGKSTHAHARLRTTRGETAQNAPPSNAQGPHAMDTRARKARHARLPATRTLVQTTKMLASEDRAPHAPKRSSPLEC
jgi:hypothetical protein